MERYFFVEIDLNFVEAKRGDQEEQGAFYCGL
jgi:hypothetical protein